MTNGKDLEVIPQLTTAPVVAQVISSGRQAQLRRFVRGCAVVPFAPGEADAVEQPAGRSSTADVVDVHVVMTAHSRGLPVITSDSGHRTIDSSIVATLSVSPPFRAPD